MKIDIEIDVMTFENCEKAYEIDRSDIPYNYVEDVPTLIRTMEYGERPILLEVQQENESAARFYERNGFKRTSYRIEDDYYFVRGL